MFLTFIELFRAVNTPPQGTLGNTEKILFLYTLEKIKLKESYKHRTLFCSTLWLALQLSIF